MGGITPPDYPTLFFFEVGQWWDYAMLLLMIAFLAGGAWLAKRNMWVFAAHVRAIIYKRRNPLTQEVHADEATYASWVRDLASEKDKELIAARLGTTPEKAGFVAANQR